MWALTNKTVMISYVGENHFHSAFREFCVNLQFILPYDKEDGSTTSAGDDDDDYAAFCCCNHELLPCDRYCTRRMLLAKCGCCYPRRTRSVTVTSPLPIARAIQYVGHNLCTRPPFKRRAPSNQQSYINLSQRHR